VIGAERSIDIFWAPKGRYLAVTDHSGSSDSTVLVAELKSAVVVNVEGAMSSTLKSYSLIHANGHRYFSVIRWQSSTRLLFGVHAYDAVPGQEVRATFVFDAKSGVVKQVN
jgi:hypothetical protein